MVRLIEPVVVRLSDWPPAAVIWGTGFIAQKKAPPTRTAIILSRESVFGMACSMACSMAQLGDRPDLQKYTGAALMLAGVVVSQVIQPKSDGGSVEMADKMLSDITQPKWGEIDHEQPRANIHRKC